MDPFCASADFDTDIACEAISVIVIPACNRCDNKMGQLFYLTDSMAAWNEGGSEKFSYTKSGPENTEFEEIVIDLTDCANWSGALLGIRFDPSEAWSGEVWIKSIDFYG